PDSDTPAFHFPTDLAGLKRLALALEGYAEHHTLAASTAFISTYLYFRAFSIPGCLPLNFLAGYLFGLPLGLALVCASTAVGASLCYLNSAWIIGPTVHFYLGARMRQWAKTVHAERDHLFSYLLILRLLPVLPSWFVSLAAPHLHIPLPIFALATLVGAIIPSFVHVQAGRALQSLDSLSSVLSPANILAILLLITLALAPVIIRK
ncbi:MAG: snare associated Golgi protein-domain-containing protein, partial [Piptocephalis tieghemiana]